MLTERLSNVFELAGAEWVMWLLLALSVASVYIMIDRLWFFAKRRVDIGALARALDGALEVDDRDGALSVALARPSMEGRVIAAGIRAMDKGPESVEEVVRGALVTERVAYDRYLPFLGTLGNNAPFIGLFGTVLGIINAFGQLSELAQGADRASAIMGDIAEALVATAIGLFVAIPAVIAYNYFKGIIKSRASHTDALTRVLLAHMKEVPPRPAGTPAADPGA